MNKRKGLWAALALVILIALFLFLLPLRQVQKPRTAVIETPSYLTGEAFDVITPATPSIPAASLTAEGERLITEADAILKKYQLNETSRTAAQRQAIAARIAEIERRITELQGQLGE